MVVFQLLVIPAKPSEFDALVIKESDSFCDALVKLMKIGVLLWKLCKFKYTVAGALTPAYRTMLCDAECPAQDVEGSTTSDNPPT